MDGFESMRFETPSADPTAGECRMRSGYPRPICTPPLVEILKVVTPNKLIT